MILSDSSNVRFLRLPVRMPLAGGCPRLFDPAIRRHCHLQSLADMLHLELARLEKHLIIVVLIRLLSEDLDLALIYFIGQRPSPSSHSYLFPEHDFVAAWDELLDDDIFALHCLLELVLPAGPFMLMADLFVMETFVVRRIMDVASVVQLVSMRF